MTAVTLSIKHLVSTRYFVERLLGEGGSSVVWQARDTASGETVALKCLKRAADGSFLLSRERFVAEAALLRDLNHPSIVPILDVGEEEDGTPYFVMPYLGDQTLATMLRDGPLSLETALQLLLPIADALTYLHARGVIHRDLKPENVSIVENADGQQRALLLDFGVAKFDGPSLTQSGLVVGTPLYMAPEQALRRRARIIDPDRRRGAPWSVMKIHKDTPRIWRIFSAGHGDASASKRVNYSCTAPK